MAVVRTSIPVSKTAGDDINKKRALDVFTNVFEVMGGEQVSETFRIEELYRIK